MGKNCFTCKYYCDNVNRVGNKIPSGIDCAKGVSTTLENRQYFLFKGCDMYEEDESFKSEEKPLLEENPKSTVDWNQRRYELSKEFLSVIMGRLNYDPLSAHYNYCACGCSEDEENNYNNPYLSVAQLSVDAADALIHILKRKGGRDEK